MCEYGVHITQAGTALLWHVDSIVLCSCQEHERGLAPDRPQEHLIGGADGAAELDARRAIEQGTRLALTLELSERACRSAMVMPGVIASEATFRSRTAAVGRAKARAKASANSSVRSIRSAWNP